MPRIGAGTYVHPSADVFGDVTIGEGCWIGPGARIRGDYGPIVIGDYCSVECKAQWTHFKKKYVDLARRYPTGWVPEE